MRSLLAGLAILVTACSPGTPSTANDTARRDALVAAVRQAAPGSTVDLRQTVGSDWERAIFLGPYIRNDEAKADLGFDFDIERVSPWVNSEGGTVVVLASGSQAVAWFALPSKDAGVHCLEDPTIPAADATLTLVEESGGYRELAKPDRLQCAPFTIR